MIYTKGIDTSTWQDHHETPQRIDWTKPKLHGVKYVINRAVFSNLKDEDFEFNWSQQRANGYLRGAYGFWDYRAGNPGPEAQARAFAAVLRPDPGEMPVAWGDFERPLATWPPLPPRATCLDQIQRYIFTLEDTLGMPGGFYMNPAMISYLLSHNGRRVDLPDWMRARALWIAAWPTVPAGETLEGYIARVGWHPHLYDQWDRWTVWQYGIGKNGRAMGMESEGVDLDYFNGDEAALMAWCKKETNGDGETKMGYSKTSNAIGLYTEKAGWKNPDFDFVVGYAGKSWLEPNQDLKAIDLQAAAEKKPFLVYYKFNLDFYIRSQLPMNKDLWPPVAKDEPLQNLITIMKNRNIAGVVIEVMDRKDHEGRLQDKDWVSFAAQIFCGRVNDWLKTNKPSVRLLLASSNEFIKAEAPNMNNWVHTYPSFIVQAAKTPLNDSFPQAADKPAYLGASTGWAMWHYYNAPGLVIYHQGPPALRAWLAQDATTPPTVDSTPPTPPTNLTAMVQSSTAGNTVYLTWGESFDNLPGAIVYRIFRNGQQILSTTSLTASFENQAPGTYQYLVEAVDKAGNASARAAVTVLIGTTIGPNDAVLLEAITKTREDLARIESLVTAILAKQNAIYK